MKENPSAELIALRWAARFGEPEDYRKALAEYQALSSEASSDPEPEYALVLCPLELDEITRGRN
jgi:hypothetical protein